MNANIKTATALKGDILDSVLIAFSNGKISDIVDLFDEHFTFTDHALGLEFSDKERLKEFFQKSRELFPDTVMKVISIIECEDHVIAEWTITASEPAPYLGFNARLPISFPGASVVRFENGKIIRWSDYYDSNKSWRFSLAAFFTDWTEI
jgi:steroid delta-isomerase-like uncharacterized protein